MREIYDLAHQLIDMAENGVSLNDIADKLMHQKQLIRDHYIETGLTLVVMVPVNLDPEELSNRYPLKMVDSHQHEAVAVSWPEEQRLRRIGYSTPEEHLS